MPSLTLTPTILASIDNTTPEPEVIEADVVHSKSESKKLSIDVIVEVDDVLVIGTLAAIWRSVENAWPYASIQAESKTVTGVKVTELTGPNKVWAVLELARPYYSVTYVEKTEDPKV